MTAQFRMVPTLINGRWRLLLPEHRAAREQWGRWVDGAGNGRFGWEAERLDSMHHELAAMVRTETVADFAGRERVEIIGRPLLIDVGTEEGDLTALYSLWGADVVMVEPNPRVWPNVRAIWHANQLRPPVDWWVGFAADTSAAAEWPHGARAEDGWPQCAHGEVIGDHAFLHLAEHPHVPRATLDELAARVDRRVDAVTIDVEGSELTVLRGARRILAEDRPLVWVSVHTDEVWLEAHYRGEGRDAVLAFMAEVGYRAELLAFDHEEHWLFRPEEAS